MLIYIQAVDTLKGLQYKVEGSFFFSFFFLPSFNAYGPMGFMSV